MTRYLARRRITKEVMPSTSRFELKRTEGEVHSLVASEDVRVKRSEVKDIPIETVKVPANRLIAPCGYVRHPLGNTVSVGEEKPKEVTSKRYLEFAHFLPFSYGEVKEGDVIGVVDFLPIEQT